MANLAQIFPSPTDAETLITAEPIMTKDEAVSHAQTFVRSKYRVVPPVVSVLHPTIRQVGSRQRLHAESWMQFHGSTEMRYSVSLLDVADMPSSDFEAVEGKWLIAFFMSWNTDAAGIPETLHVLVDDQGQVTPISPE
jgi:hypothetical protein